VDRPEHTASLLLEGFAGLMAVCAVVPATLFALNLRRYKLPFFGAASSVPLAVLIPARDEELNIRECLESVLASEEVELEVLVLDDDSADRTVSIVLDMAARDARVTLLRTAGLPSGWNGKQHACWQLANATRAPVMLFLDADVRVEPWALARCVAARRKSSASLLSGFPRQITVGFMEKMLLPLINFVLLGFLPMGKMRKTTKPAYAAGCGQFILVERGAYFACGGHAAIRNTRHDGLLLPKLFRENGLRTDLVDLTALASVRMYRTASAVWQGLAKNATEGIGAAQRIGPFTLLLLLGQILPMLAACLWAALLTSMIVTGATFDDPLAAAFVTLLLMVAVVASYIPRLVAARRFKQPLLSALLHPLGVTLLLLVQWYALLRQLLGRPVGWRTRMYSSDSGAEV
jgi:hypothetical protein